MLALRRVSGCAPWPRGTFCLMGQNFIRFSGHVTPLEHSTWFPGGTSCLLGRTVGLSKAISCFLGAEPGRVVLGEDLQGQRPDILGRTLSVSRGSWCLFAAPFFFARIGTICDGLVVMLGAPRASWARNLVSIGALHVSWDGPLVFLRAHRASSALIKFPPGHVVSL